MSKSKNEVLQERIKDFFAKNKAADRVYTTSDGNLFSAEHYANNWAFELKDRKVNVISRVVDEAIQNAKDRIAAGKAGDDLTGDDSKDGSGSGSTEGATDERVALVNEYIELFDTKPTPHNIGLAKLKAKIAEKKAELAATEYFATEEDLKNNPALVEQGVKVGDKIELPKEEK